MSLQVRCEHSNSKKCLPSSWRKSDINLIMQIFLHIDVAINILITNLIESKCSFYFYEKLEKKSKTTKPNSFSEFSLINGVK